MEAQMGHPPPSVSSAYPHRVMLKQCCSIEDSCSTADDAKTLAAARTSTNHLIQVFVRLEDDPLAPSRVCIKVPDGDEAEEYYYHNGVVVAAHCDSLLIRVEERQYHYGYTNTSDHFIYNAGDVARDPPRPPSLSLLPPVCRRLHGHGTGLLCRGEDELVVADLSEVLVDVDTEVAELHLFRSGEWSVKRLPISYGGDAGEVRELLSLWRCDTVVPVGDRQLCWVHLERYVLICDVFEKTPKLQYLRLPMDPCLGKTSKRNVCATAGGGALKFVNMFPRCCCGGAGASCCERSRHAYTIHTWMLRLDGDDAMEWVKDGIIDATELWALNAYKGLPRVPLEYPVMSMDEPHVVYFQLCERHHVKHGGDDTLWLLKVDTRSKTIQSVSHHIDGFSCIFHMLIPSNVANASNGALTMGQRQKSVDRPPVVVVDEHASNLMLQQPSSLMEPSEQASEIFEALLEISRYGLDGDELKAYRILSQDNGRRFRSLLRLPKNLRKDWLLKEIMASQ